MPVTQREIMTSAVNLATANGELFLADVDYDEGGWITLYTHQPAERATQLLSQVSGAIKPSLNSQNSSWEWRLFTPTGYIECAADETRSMRMKTTMTRR